MAEQREENKKIVRLAEAVFCVFNFSSVGCPGSSYAVFPDRRAISLLVFQKMRLAQSMLGGQRLKCPAPEQMFGAFKLVGRLRLPENLCGFRMLVVLRFNALHRAGADATLARDLAHALAATQLRLDAPFKRRTLGRSGIS
jgi:hypothetical protein